MNEIIPCTKCWIYRVLFDTISLANYYVIGKSKTKSAHIQEESSKRDTNNHNKFKKINNSLVICEIFHMNVHT